MDLTCAEQCPKPLLWGHIEGYKRFCLRDSPDICMDKQPKHSCKNMHRPYSMIYHIINHRANVSSMAYWHGFCEMIKKTQIWYIACYDIWDVDNKEWYMTVILALCHLIMLILCIYDSHVIYSLDIMLHFTYRVGILAILATQCISSSWPDMLLISESWSSLPVVWQDILCDRFVVTRLIHRYICWYKL